MTEVSLEEFRHSLNEADVSLTSSSPRFLCAVSGGLDSMVLVHLLKRLGCPLRAIHIDHAAQPDSAKWADWVVHQLSRIDVAAEVHRLEGAAPSRSLEEHWRNARRFLFLQSLRKGEVLVTAHHQDDQVETLLLQLLRGAGPVGLQAMPLGNELSPHGQHVRPLLRYTRAQLESFARSENIEWLDDPSNTDERFSRNYLRHSVLPLLYQRWPGAGAAMTRSRALIAESVGLNEALAALDANISDDGTRLDWSSLASLDQARKANAVRFWLKGRGVRMPSRKRLEEALRQWDHAAGDRLPLLTLDEGSIQRYRSELVFAGAISEPLHDWSGGLRAGMWLPLPGDQGELGWSGREPAQMGDDTTHALAGAIHTLALCALIESQHFRVGYRQGGEKLRRAAGHHQSLKHWFQDHGVAPVLRDRLPLVYLGADLIAIADIWIDARFRPQKESPVNEKVCRLIWRRPSAVKAQ